MVTCTQELKRKFEECLRQVYHGAQCIIGPRWGSHRLGSTSASRTTNQYCSNIPSAMDCYCHALKMAIGSQLTLQVQEQQETLDMLTECLSIHQMAVSILSTTITALPLQNPAALSDHVAKPYRRTGKCKLHPVKTAHWLIQTQNQCMGRIIWILSPTSLPMLPSWPSCIYEEHEEHKVHNLH